MANKGLLAIVNCGQLVTLAGPARPRIREEMGDLAILTNGAMLIRDGVVESTGTQAEIEPLITAGHQVIDAAGRVVMPGFVDAHTHLVFGGNRTEEYEMRSRGATYEEISAAGGGIRSSVRKTRAASEDELATSARRRREWFIRWSDHRSQVRLWVVTRSRDEDAARDAPARSKHSTLQIVPTFLGAHEYPDEYRERRGEYLELLIHEMLPAIASQHLAEYCDIFCEPKVFDIASAERYLSAVRATGLGIRVHADQLTRSRSLGTGSPHGCCHGRSS